MALPLEKFREIVFLALFGKTHNVDTDDNALMNLIMQELKVSRSSAREGVHASLPIISTLSEIDQMITSVSTSFAFDRIQEAERAILRLSFWELFFEKKVPPHVVLSEAKRLVKKFADEGAVRFVLAILINACQKQGIQL